MAFMPEVKFPEYRQYLEQRQLVNSAVMALLAGSQLAVHTLKLTSGSDRTMSEIFPQVPHINRFNLKPDTASSLLSDAEAHLSAMAIPYILTVQESLFGTFESMLAASGNPARRKNKSTSPVWIVKDHWAHLGHTLDEPSWLVFELLVALRHDITHRAGVVGEDLVKRSKALTPAAESLWQRMSQKPLPTFTEGTKHVLDHADMVVCLAVVKFLADEGNNIMQTCYSRSCWIADFIRDANTNIKIVGNLLQKTRKCRSFARLNYGALNFSTQEIEEAIKAM